MEIILHNIGVFITLGFAIWAIWRPLQMSKFVSLQTKGSRGISEIRSIYGGWNLGLSGFAIYVQDDSVFYCLGFAWLIAAIVRFLTIFIDDAYSPKLSKFILVEVMVAILLLINW